MNVSSRITFTSFLIHCNSANLRILYPLSIRKQQMIKNNYRPANIFIYLELIDNFCISQPHYMHCIRLLMLYSSIYVCGVHMRLIMRPCR